VSTMMLCVIPVRWCSAVAISLAALYQYALSWSGLTNFILHGADGRGGRQGLLNANREGILSSVGYIALYLIGVQIGCLLFSKKKRTLREWMHVLLLLLLTSVAGYVCQWAAACYIQPCSRRMANITFVFWIVGVSVQTTCACLAVDLLSTALTALCLAHHKKIDNLKSEAAMLTLPGLVSSSPCLLTAVNSNGLFFFVLANVLTGLTNMAAPTHHMAAAPAVAILLVYSLVLSAVVMFMARHKVHTKVW